MRKFMLLLSLVALAAPVAALADAPPSPAQTANAMCAAAKTSMGASFATTYGTNASKANAFGKCVSAHAKAATDALHNAAKACKAQNLTGKSAMGKCVSQAVQSTVAAQAKASKSALKSCKAAMKADQAAFATTYGSGKDALGKCVSAKSGTK